MAMLKVTHASEQILDEFGLLDGRPPVKIMQALVLLLVELVGQELIKAAIERARTCRRKCGLDLLLLLLLLLFDDLFIRGVGRGGRSCGI